MPKLGRYLTENAIQQSQARDRPTQTEGTITFYDVTGKNFQIEWRPMYYECVNNGQSGVTPLLEVLKGSVYKRMEELEKMNLKVQRLELINKDTHLDPLPITVKEGIDAICLVGNITVKGMNLWFGETWSFHGGYCVHLTTNYPQIDQKLIMKGITNREVKEEIENIVKSRNFTDPKDISLDLRNELLKYNEKIIFL